MESADHEKRQRVAATRLVPAFLILLSLSALAVAEEPKVSITGGLRPDGSFYSWVVTNLSSSPVVSLEFPHYQADQFLAPPGWKSKSEYLVNVGVPDRPGTCRAWVESPKDGIPRQGKVSVTMRVRLLEARQGRGVVKVGFADGTTLEIAGVEIPMPPGYFERFGVLITLVILVGLAGLIAVRRQRRAKAREEALARGGSASGETPPKDRS
jgi:hypothetical protein